MALNIKDEVVDRLVRELAAETGESITTAVSVATRERLERLRGAVPRERRTQEMLRLARRCAALPVLDHRTPDEILGYGPDGLPRRRAFTITAKAGLRPRLTSATASPTGSR